MNNSQLALLAASLIGGCVILSILVTVMIRRSRRFQSNVERVERAMLNATDKNNPQ